jgi:hypothetical protein
MKALLAPCREAGTVIVTNMGQPIPARPPNAPWRLLAISD